ncbi:MAG: CotH kinase family protein [Vicinamibacterales bacterium]
MLRQTTSALILALSLLAAPLAQQTVRPQGWSDATHGARVAPDYARLFRMDTVHDIRISIPADRFRAMQADLEDVTRNGPFGRGGFGPPGAGGPGGPGGAGPGGPPPFGRGRGAPIMPQTREPNYVSVTVEHDGHVWTKVAMRYKGNSSLMAATTQGNGKIPFRLNFDRYEDESPDIEDQRFYGFKELTFSSNYADESQLREVLASEVFRDRGVPAPRAAFYRVFVNSGSGYEYWGLYAMVEDPGDGAMLQAQFGSRNGNLYKPDGPGADWSEFNAEGFEKKTNAREADFSDARAAVAALHAPMSPAAAWRAGLERAFDVDHFLRWLAINTAMSNWDVYGALPHNYYLYGDPARSGRLRWIPWDNNEAFSGGPGAGGRRGGPPGGPPGGPGGGGALPIAPPGAAPFPGFGPAPNDVLHAQVGPEWPLIQRVLADPLYQQRYRTELERALGGLMAPAALAKRARELHALIASSVTGRDGERATHTTISSAAAFEASIDGPDGLIPFVQTREQMIRNALRGAPRQ